MTQYHEQYRCRRCGGLFDSGKVVCEKDAISALEEYALESPAWFSHVHDCGHGNIGIGIIAGYEKRETEEQHT